MELCSPCAQGAPGITQSDNVHGHAGEHRMHTAYVRSWFHVELKGIERENVMILAKGLFGTTKPPSQFPWDGLEMQLSRPLVHVKHPIILAMYTVEALQLPHIHP